MGRKTVNWDMKILYMIGMVCIVAGHCGAEQYIPFSFLFPVYSFHLVIFAFASGYLYNSGNEECVVVSIGRKAKRLILPLYLWDFVYGILGQFIKRFGFLYSADLSVNTLLFASIMGGGGHFVLNAPSWFVIPLFVIYVLNLMIRRVLYQVTNKRNLADTSMMLIYSVIGISGVILALQGYYEGIWLLVGRVSFFLPFYGLGIIYRRYFEIYDRKISNGIYFTIVISVQLALIFINGKAKVYYISGCRDFDNWYMPFIVNFVALTFWLRVAHILEPILKGKKVVSLIADNTFSIMVHQYLIFNLVNLLLGMMNPLMGICNGFSWKDFMAGDTYIYVPRGLQQFTIVYMIAGIAIPILIQKGINHMLSIGKYHIKKNKDKLNKQNNLNKWMR